MNTIPWLGATVATIWLAVEFFRELNEFALGVAFSVLSLVFILHILIAAFEDYATFKEEGDDEE